MLLTATGNPVCHSAQLQLEPETVSLHQGVPGQHSRDFGHPSNAICKLHLILLMATCLKEEGCWGRLSEKTLWHTGEKACGQLLCSFRLASF